MTLSKKRKYSAAFKSKVAYDALLQLGTIAELSSKYGVHATQINRWKNHLKSKMSELFSDQSQRREIRSKDKLIEELYRQIGQQKVELDWLKKKFKQLPP